MADLTDRRLDDDEVLPVDRSAEDGAWMALRHLRDSPGTEVLFRLPEIGKPEIGAGPRESLSVPAGIFL
jgi:hypothetical protein